MSLYWADTDILSPVRGEWRQSSEPEGTIFGDSIRIVFESEFGFEPRYRLGHVWIRQLFNMPARTVTRAFRVYPKPEPMILDLETPEAIKGTGWEALRWLQVKQGGRYPPHFPVRLRIQQLRISNPDDFVYDPLDPVPPSP